MQTDETQFPQNEMPKPRGVDVKVKEKETPKVAEPTPIPTDSKGMMMPTNHKQVLTIIDQISKGGGFPVRFKTFESKIAAYNLANSLMGTQWQLAINNIADIKGQMTIFGELPGTLAERTGQVELKKVYVIDKDYNEIKASNKNLSAKPWAGVCRIKRKGREENEFFYTIDEATAAGRYPAMKPEYVNDRKTGRMIPNGDSPWMKDTKIMLMRRAMGQAVKFEFPEALVGVPIAEFDFDIAPDIAPVRDVSTTPDDNINEEYSDEAGAM